jgi:hypothetical protein
VGESLSADSDTVNPLFHGFVQLVATRRLPVFIDAAATVHMEKSVLCRASTGEIISLCDPCLFSLFFHWTCASWWKSVCSLTHQHSRSRVSMCKSTGFQLTFFTHISQTLRRIYCECQRTFRGAIESGFVEGDDFRFQHGAGRSHPTTDCSDATVDRTPESAAKYHRNDRVHGVDTSHYPAVLQGASAAQL